MIARLLLAIAFGFEWLHDKWNWLTATARIGIKCVSGDYWVGFPPILARLVQPKWFKDQIEKAKSDTAGGKKGAVKFVRCPGMHDYFTEGYIIRAHADIHIKANSAGQLIVLPSVNEPQLQPAGMDFEVIDGIAPIGEGVPRAVTKIPLPYGIYLEPGHSAHLLPPLLHADYFDKIFVYPGTVDYDKFHVANWIISVIKPCEFVIPAGTPLLHVLPFKRISYHGQTGPATKKEVAYLRYGFPSRIMGAYRKLFHSKKTYTNEVTK